MSKLQKQQNYNSLKHALLRAIENQNNMETLDIIIVLWEQIMQNMGVSWEDIEILYLKLYREIDNPECRKAIDYNLDLDKIR